MAMQRERLEKVYEELGDEHLRDLAEEPENLTDAARLAVAAEMRRRGFAPEPVDGEAELGAPEAAITPVTEPELETGFGAAMPGIFPGGASMMEQALEPAESAKDGMSRLISFYDGIELGKACELLEDARMEPVIEPIAGDALSGVPPRFEVWLETGDIEAAKALLRAKMGLFPAAEVDDEDFAEQPASGLVGVFESAEDAYEVRDVLVEDGIEATVTHDADDGMWQVTVAPEEQERSIAVVTGELGLG
jgi:hypothetical protein